jgi:hypothetical protein
MKTLKTGIVLLALLLAGMAMVPIVSAGEEQLDVKSFVSSNDVIESNYVAIDTAYTHATFSLVEFASIGAQDEKQKWFGAIVNPRPLVINDLNGKKLFYLFSIERNNQKIGEIRIAANKVIGGSLISIGTQNKSIDINSIEKSLQSELKKNNAESISKSQLVCYAYPKIGLVNQYSDPTTKISKTIIVDAYDYSVIVNDNPNLNENHDFYSLYGLMDTEKYSSAINLWTQYDDTVQSMLKMNPSLLPSSENPLSEQHLQLYIQNTQGTRTVTEYYVMGGVPLYNQPNGLWCAVTTARMISAKWGTDRSTDAIASKMGAGTAEDPVSTKPQMELIYYKATIATGGLEKFESDNYELINWDDSKTEIDADRPFKVGNYDGHARAVIGYTRSTSSPYYTYFYIKDPAPIGQGSEYWEWFNNLNPLFYTGHLKVRF